MKFTCVKRVCKCTCIKKGFKLLQNRKINKLCAIGTLILCFLRIKEERQKSGILPGVYEHHSFFFSAKSVSSGGTRDFG